MMSMPGTKLRIALILLGAAVLFKCLAEQRAKPDAQSYLRLFVSGTNCIVHVNGVERRAMTGFSMGRGERIGIYAFHSFETPDSSQFLTRLEVAKMGRESSDTLSVGLGSGEAVRNFFEPDAGWVVREGKGIRHEGRPGERSVLLAKDFAAQDFYLQIAISNAVDCGVIFRASDGRNGTVLTVRPEKNDILMFKLRNGEPELSAVLEAYDELRSGKELLRVAGLAGDLAIRFAVFIVLAMLAIRFLPVLRIRRRITEAAGGMANPRVLAVGVFVMSFAALGMVSALCFHAIPHITDEVAYYFQARVFAEGRLWAPVPEDQEFFKHEHLIMKDGRWFSKYPPLFSAVLAVALKLGPFWLANPFIGALAAVVLFLLLRRLLGTGWALAGWGLLISSPTFLFMGGNMMAHMLTALFLWLFALLVLYGMEKDRWWIHLLAGAFLGAAAATRPYSALLFAVPFGVWLAVRWVAARPLVFPKALLLIAAGALPCLGVYFGWQSLVVSGATPSLNLYDAYHAADTLGFGADKGKGWYTTWGTYGHTPAKALRSVYNYLEYFSRDMFGWPLRLSLCLATVPFLLRRKEDGALPLVLGAVFLLFVVGHMLYWAAWYIFFGVRYWFCAFPGLVILSAMGMRRLLERQDAGSAEAGGVRTGSAALGVVVCGMVAWNLAAHLPDRLKEGPNYGNTSDRLQKEVAARNLHKAIVFVETRELVFNDGFWMNDPFMKSDVVFAMDLGDKNRELVARHPGWTAYRWDKRNLVEIPLNAAAGPAKEQHRE